VTPVWVIGSGGHAKVVIDTLRAAGAYHVAGLLDDSPERLGASVLGVRVESHATPESISRLGVRYAVIAVGENRARAAIADRLRGLVAWPTVIHPRAHLASGVRVGEGAQVFAGAVIQPDSIIGDHVIINTSSSVDHDGRIESFVHVGPGVHVAGGVTIGAGVLLGIGASVLPGCTVGPWATIGAGAVVVRDIPGGLCAKGVPARIDAE
jgi:UDP-perosamine 4-acetyltransferase